MENAASLATTEYDFEGYVIHYGAYEREGHSQGWNGLYRIFKEGVKVFGADYTAQPPFSTRELAERATRDVAEKYVKSLNAKSHQ